MLIKSRLSSSNLCAQAYQIYINRKMGSCLNGTPQYRRCPYCGDSGAPENMMHHQCGRGGNTNNSFPRTNQQYRQQAPLKHAYSLQTMAPPTNAGRDICEPFINTKFPPEPNVFEPRIYNGSANFLPNQFIYVKAPIDSTRTKFRWVREKARHYPPGLIQVLSPDVIRMRSFQQKMLWFRLNVQKMRVSWQNGSEVLKVDRSNLIISSYLGIQKKDLKKQLKIEFDDEKVSDAGGLLRQWMHLIIEQIFHKNTGIFQMCKSDETAYKFVWDKQLDFDYAQPFVRLLGIIIGKALFERVSLNCYLNRGIWRKISGYTNFLHDAYSFDADLFNNWRYILDNEGAQDLCLQFYEIKTHSNGQTEEVELVQGGKSIAVNDQNKMQYIFHMVQLYCYRSIKKYVEILKEGVNRVIPQQFLSVFEPHEFEMLLNGPQFIDAQDWKANTLYKGYKSTDQVIIWFWQVVCSYDQEMLANLLHYCTGSNRVPILGFKYLQSNRNTIVKFTIEKVKSDKHNPYPRSYTCFNRIQLPEYKSFNELKQNLGIVVSNKITSFGLD